MCSVDSSKESISEIINQADKEILELKTRLRINQHNFNSLMNDMFLFGQLSASNPEVYRDVLHTVASGLYDKDTILYVNENNNLTLGRIAAITKSMHPLFK
jgi:hypothetical protein